MACNLRNYFSVSSPRAAACVAKVATLCESQPRLSCASPVLPTSRVVPLLRSRFDDTAGSLLLKRLATPSSAESTFYLSNAAARAALSFTSEALGIDFNAGTLTVAVDAPTQYMQVDAATIRSLEVLAPLHPEGGCLFNLLNRTTTSGGSAMLKRLMIQPLRDQNEINMRLDGLAALIGDESLYTGLSALVARLPTAFETTASTFAKSVLRSNDATGISSACTALLAIREGLLALPPLADALSSSNDPFLLSFLEAVSSPVLRELDDAICGVLDDGVLSGKARFVKWCAAAFAVRSGVDTFLDVARKAYSDAVESVHGHVASLRQSLAVTGLAVRAVFARCVPVLLSQGWCLLSTDVRPDIVPSADVAFICRALHRFGTPHRSKHAIYSSR